MKTKTVTFRILRYKPNRIDPPRFQNFSLKIEPDVSVLDALEKIRLEQDNTLMYRHSCHHSSCGTCACRINGEERLTCITKLADLEGDIITLTPLKGFLVNAPNCLFRSASMVFSSREPITMIRMSPAFKIILW